MLGRRLHSLLDNIRPSLERKVNVNQERQKKAHDSHASSREFVIGDQVYVKNYGSGNSWLPGKVTNKLGSTMYGVLLNDGRSVRKHADQMRSRIGNDNSVDNSVEMNVDDNDSFEMRVPRTNERSEMNSDAAIESSGGETPLTSTAEDSTNTHMPEQETESTSDNIEPNLPQLRCSTRQRRPPDVVPI